MAGDTERGRKARTTRERAITTRQRQRPAEVCPDAGSSMMQLPHLDGLELIQQLWEAHPPFTREDLERLMMALARCWSVEA